MKRMMQADVFTEEQMRMSVGAAVSTRLIMAHWFFFFA
jgi:hypothetical protein